MPPIVAFKLPVLLPKPLDPQLLTFYLIRSNPHKEPFDINRVTTKKVKKRSRLESPVKFSQPGPPLEDQCEFKKPKSHNSVSTHSRNLSSSKYKQENVKPSSKTNPSTSQQPSTSKKSKNESKLKKTSAKTFNSKSLSSSNTRPDTSSSKIAITSTTSSSSASASASKNASTTKIVTPKKKTSPSLSSSSSSSKASSVATPAINRPKPVKAILSNPIAERKKQKLKEKKIPKDPKIADVASVFGTFKIPKRVKPPVSPETGIPKRLQPSGYSPLDDIIGTNSGLTGPSKTSNDPCKVMQSLEEDLDPLESEEPELGFDLYEIDEPNDEQSTEDFSSEPFDPLTEETESLGNIYEEEELSNQLADIQQNPYDAISSSSLSFSTSSRSNQSLKSHFDDSDSSDEESEVSFKRQGAKDKIVIEPDEPIKLSDRNNNNHSTRSRISSSSDDQTPGNFNIISFQPSTSRSSVPSRSQSTSSQPPAQPQPQPQPQPPPPTPLDSQISSIILSIENIQSPEESMKKFLAEYYANTEIFLSNLSLFQSLFKKLFVNLFCDVQFKFDQKKFKVVIELMRTLQMNDSHHWEDIICRWGQNYEPLLSNESKLKNMITLITGVYDHLQSNMICVNLVTADSLFMMKMVRGNLDSN